MIPASVVQVWALIGDPRRYPEWWPRVIEVQGERFEQGDEYVQVTRSPKGTQTTQFLIEQLEDMREIRMHCTKTGTFAHWRLTDAQGETFVDLKLGMEPIGASNRAWDLALGRRYFRRWIDDSVEGLRNAVPSP